MKSIFNWYNSLNKWPQSLLRAFFISVPFYFAAYLSNSIAEAAKNPIQPLLIHAVVYTVLLTVVVFISIQIKSSYDDYTNKILEQKQNIYQAYVLAERATSKNMNAVKRHFDHNNSISYQALASMEKIQELITAAYNTFEILYGHNNYDKEGIDFEVTFMTKSYQDGEITIPASANKVNRSPRSMLLRKDNPNTYNNTITAHIYSSPNPSCQIINNTQGIGIDYEAVYPGQKERIQSTIVCPVLSSDNEVLGTIVVHCDKADFFQHKDKKYWVDLLEVFSKGIAIEKIKLDLSHKCIDSNNSIIIEFGQETFF